MYEGKTKSGFSYKISEERLNNYELVEALGDLETNPLNLAKVITMLLGPDQATKLKNHVRTDEGFVPTRKMEEEIMEIFQEQAKAKN